MDGGRDVLLRRLDQRFFSALQIAGGQGRLHWRPAYDEGRQAILAGGAGPTRTADPALQDALPEHHRRPNRDAPHARHRFRENRPGAGVHPPASAVSSHTPTTIIRVPITMRAVRISSPRRKKKDMTRTKIGDTLASGATTLTVPMLSANTSMSTPTFSATPAAAK